MIGAYDYLLDWHLRWYIEDGPEKHKKAVFEHEICTDEEATSEWRLKVDEKRRILLNNIHGVDIDFQAVEVTKLSLLLKVLEGETSETVNDQPSFFRERALPDLSNNIKCGNSLIGHDIYDNEQMNLLNEDKQRRINTFPWQDSFPQVFSGKNPGFDVVIGNPPYGGYLYTPEKGYLKSKYKQQSYQLDSYLLFLERALVDLLRWDGFYGMIVPNPWRTNLLQGKIRQFVTESTRIHEIVHFRFPVFPKVAVDTEIVVLQKGYSKRWQASVTVVESLQDLLEPGENVERIQHSQEEWQALNGDAINIFLSPAEKQLAKKCSNVSEPTGSLFDINVGIKPYQTGKGTPPQTKEIVQTRPYDSDERLDSSFRPYLRGGDIARYTISPLQQRYIKYGAWLAEPRPAANFDAVEKIVMRQTGDSLVATLDVEKYLCLNNMHVLVPKIEDVSILYLLGIINSRLLNWYYHTLNPEVGEALAEVKKTNVAKLPIRTLDSSDPEDAARHEKMVELVEQMLPLHEQLSNAKVPAYRSGLQGRIKSIDEQINQLVYEMYGLSEEEIEIVEGKD